MLTITEEATTAIEQIVASPELPDNAGLRIASSDEPGRLELSVTLAPNEDDVVVDVGDEGARVFLEPEAADFLDDKVLDAAPVAGGQLRFSITEQDVG